MKILYREQHRDGDGHTTQIGFKNIRDAKAVEAMLKQLATTPPNE